MEFAKLFISMMISLMEVGNMRKSMDMDSLNLQRVEITV
jgi:hypothetical protein